MFNKNSFKAVEESKFSKQFVKPLYQSYCFSNIPPTIKFLLTSKNKNILPLDVFGDLPKKYEKVILFFIDAFGWRFFEKYADSLFLKKIADEGVISKLTSQFPSTTSAHTTTIHTGLSVGESGVYEWFYYEPKLDTIIAPLLFSFAGAKKRDTLKPTGISPKELYPATTFYQQLKKDGIKSYLFQHHEYTPSPYSDTVFKDAKVIPYKTLPEAIINLFEILKNEKEKSYYFLYFDKIDAICHEYGPNSKQLEAEIISFLQVMEKIFLENFHQYGKNCLFMMTADHGQVEIEPKTTVYLNKKFPQIKIWIKTNKKGKLLVPAGLYRDMFLHIKKEYLEKAKDYLTKKLEGIAEVYFVSDLVKQGFFGTRISQTFLSRVGDLVILPYKNESVWWYEKDKFEVKYFGNHGGLTKEEMEIPFLVLSS